MAIYELRVGDTYPPINILLSDSSGTPGVDLTNMSSVIRFEAKGQVAPLVSGICTIQQIDITATTSSTTSLTAVTPITGYANGATIYSPTGDIPVGTTIVSGAGTSSIVISSAATTSLSARSFIVNIGLVQLPLTNLSATGFTTADTYECEVKGHWAAGGQQTFPNAIGQDFTIIVDTALASS